MIPSSARSIAPTHPLSLGFVVVSHPEVNLSVLVEHSLKLFSVWGVIWLIIAFIFFAAGVIVGIVAFKVSTYSFLPVVITDGRFCIRSLQNNRKRRVRNSSLLLDPVVPWHLHRYRVSLS
jgi:hypothetical protein